MHRRSIGMAAIALALAALASSASAQSGRPRIPGPEFSKTPTGGDVMRFYPAKALRAEVEGEATIHCTVQESGTLADCKVVAEKPLNYGFGEAALKMASIFKVRTPSADGKPGSRPGDEIDIPIRFRGG